MKYRAKKKKRGRGETKPNGLGKFKNTAFSNIMYLKYTTKKWHSKNSDLCSSWKQKIFDACPILKLKYNRNFSRIFILHRL